MIDQHRDQELGGRGDELEHADGRIGQSPRRRGEQQQRPGRNHPGRHQQPRLAPAMAEHRRAGGPVPHQPAERDRNQHHRLDRQSGEGVDRDHLSHQAIGGEAEAQHQTDPQGIKRADRQHRHPGRRQRHRAPLQPGQSLAEQEPAHQDIGQRVEIIAEAAGQHPAAVDRIDVDQPVDRDQYRRRRQRQPQLRAGQRRAHRTSLAGGEHHQHQHDHRPGDPVGDDIDRPDVGQQLEIDRQNPPRRISGEAQHQPFAVAAIGGGGVGQGWRRVHSGSA